MKQFFSLFLFCLLYSNISFADSTTVKICNSGEYSFQHYNTINKDIDRFDSLGRLIQNETWIFEFLSWDQQDTVFRLVTRTDYVYNLFGFIDTMLETQVNFNSTFYFRYNFLYDTSGNLSEKLRFAGSSFPLDSNLKTTYQYDSNNNITQQLEAQFVLNQSFSTSTLMAWSYDAQERNIEYRKINYQSNVPHDSLIDTYTYSASSKILSKKQLGYATLFDSSYYDYVYDTNDSLIRYTYYGNSSSTDWIPSRTYEYSYLSDTTIEMILNCPDTSCSDTMLRVTTLRDFASHTLYNLREEYSGFDYWDITSIQTNSYNQAGNIVDHYSHFINPGCNSAEHITYDYNSSEDLIHSYRYSYHCNEYFTDCYYYNVDSDSILVSIQYNDTNCSNTRVPFVVTVEGGVPPYQYDWTPGNYLSDSTIMYPYISNVDTILTYRLLITDSQGRTASDTMKLYGYPNNYVPINIISFGIPCENNSFHLTMDTIPLNYSYYWTSPNSPNNYNDSIEANFSGNYNLYLTDTNRCKYSYQTTVNLFTQPIVSLGPDTTICLNDTVVLSAGNFVQYDWNTGDTSPSIETFSQFPTTDTIFVIITDTNGCFNSDTISVNHVVCLGQDDLYNSGIMVSVFPNHLQIDLPSILPNTKFKLIDIFGRVIIDKDIHDDHFIDISNLHSGVYIYNMENYSGKFFRE
jgi:hypothetical protein